MPEPEPAPAVAVIGAGVATPAGCTIEAMMEVLESAKVLAAEADFATDDYRSHLCTRVVDFDPLETLSRPDSRRLPRAVQLMLGTALRVAASCRDDWARIEEEPAVVVGTGIGGLSRYDEAVEEQARGHRRVSPLTVPMIMPSAAASELSIRLPSRAPSLTVSGACASGSMALIHAVHMIRSGRAKVVIAGGGEGLLTSMIFGAFSRTEAMVPGVDEPAGPFDVDRQGFVMGEGAGFTVLAAMDACAEAGVEPVAEILGVGESTDAFHIAAPDPDGFGAALAMQRALADAGLDGDDIGHISAHATATSTGDVAEAAGIIATFPRLPPVTAHKGALGHLIGGAGAVSAIAAWTSAQRGLVPPIAGLRHLDPEISLPVVVDAPLPIEPGRPAMVNAFAFGGLNTSLIVR